MTVQHNSRIFLSIRQSSQEVKSKNPLISSAFSASRPSILRNSTKTCVSRNSESSTNSMRRPSSSLSFRPRSTRSSRTSFDLKNLQVLRRFLTEQGKIISRRLTGLSAGEQRQLTSAVKQARILGLLAFTPTSLEQNQ